MEDVTNSPEVLTVREWRTEKVGKATQRTRRQSTLHSLISRHSMFPLLHGEEEEEEETPAWGLNIPRRACGSRQKSDSPQSSSVDGSAVIFRRLHGASSSWPPSLRAPPFTRSPSSA